MGTLEDFDSQFQRLMQAGPDAGPPPKNSFDETFQQAFGQAQVPPPPPVQVAPPTPQADTQPASGLEAGGAIPAAMTPEKFDQTQGPGFFQRSIVQPLERIGGAAAEGFSQGFAQGPQPQATADAAAAALQGPVPAGVAAYETPVAHLFAQGVGALSYLAAGGISAAQGLEQGAFSGFRQSLVEAGVPPDDATRASDSIKEFFDVGGIATGLEPFGLPGALQTTFRNVTQADKYEKYRLAIRDQQEELARNRAINLAKMKARQAATQAGEPPVGQDIAVAQVDTAAGRMADAQVQAAAVPYIREPDQILTDVPVFTHEVLTTPRMQQAVDFAREVLQRRGGIDPTGLTNDRVFKDVIGLIGSEGLSTSGFMADLHAAGLTEQEFLQMLGYSASEYGRGLQTLSTFYRGLREQALRGEPGAADFLDAAFQQSRQNAKIGAGLTAMEAGEPWLRQSTRIFRKLLVSLPATAVRNFIDSGLFRYVINASNRSVDLTLQRLFTPRGTIPPASPFDELGNMFDTSGLLGSRVTPTGVAVNVPSNTRRRVDLLIAAFPEARHRLFTAIEADLATDRGLLPQATALDKVEGAIDRSILTMNRAQEEIVRRATFAAGLDRRLRALGVDGIEGMVDAGQVPAGFDKALGDSIEESLFTTFAAAPRGREWVPTFFRAYANLIDASKIGPFMEPFPKFLFNATKLTLEQMSTGGLRLIRPINRAKIAEGDFSPLARELTGTALLATAFAIRHGQFPGLKPGPRWDEVETSDGKVISLAPFATLAPHLFLADLIDRIDEGHLQPSVDLYAELRRGLVGSSTQANFMTDATQEAIKGLLEIKSPMDLSNLADLGQQIAGGFARPLQIIRDFKAESDEAYRLQRETRGQGVDAGVRALLDPGSLPVRESPTRGGPLEAPQFPIPGTRNPQTGQPDTIGAGMLSEFSGLTARPPRNPAEREIARLGFTAEQLSPKTGDKRLDALVARYQGPVFETLGRAIVTSPTYIALPVKTKMFVIQDLIAASRQPGLRAAAVLAPTAVAEQELERLPGLKLQAIMEEFNKLTGPSGPKAEDLLQRVQDQADQELKKQGL